MKKLRGTALDPFARLADRKLERQLIAEYEQLVEQVLGTLGADNHAVAVELAALPEEIRGFGHVKLKHLEPVRKRQAELLAKLRGEVASPIAA